MVCIDIGKQTHIIKRKGFDHLAIFRDFQFILGCCTREDIVDFICLGFFCGCGIFCECNFFRRRGICDGSNFFRRRGICDGSSFFRRRGICDGSSFFRGCNFFCGRGIFRECNFFCGRVGWFCEDIFLNGDIVVCFGRDGSGFLFCAYWGKGDIARLRFFRLNFGIEIEDKIAVERGVWVLGKVVIGKGIAILYEFTALNGVAVFVEINGVAVFVEINGIAVFIVLKGIAIFVVINGIAVFVVLKRIAIFVVINGVAVFVVLNAILSVNKHLDILQKGGDIEWLEIVSLCMDRKIVMSFKLCG